MVEMDVRRTGDGKLALSHDAAVAGNLVAGTPWSALAESEVGGGHHPALLDEVLAALPGTPAQLEVKNHPLEPGYEPDHRLGLETAERARQGDMVTSFNPKTLEAIRRTYPQVPTGLAVAGGSLGEALEWCRDAGHEALIAEHSLIRARANIEVDIYAWTVNSRARARELVELGVRGIITDDPGSIADTLGSHR